MSTNTTLPSVKAPAKRPIPSPVATGSEVGAARDRLGQAEAEVQRLEDAVVAGEPVTGDQLARATDAIRLAELQVRAAERAAIERQERESAEAIAAEEAKLHPDVIVPMLRAVDADYTAALAAVEKLRGSADAYSAHVTGAIDRIRYLRCIPAGDAVIAHGRSQGAVTSETLVLDLIRTVLPDQLASRLPGQIAGRGSEVVLLRRLADELSGADEDLDPSV